MKDFDMFCIDCNSSLPISANRYMQRCNKCTRIYRRKYNQKLYYKQSKNKKLAKFYSFQRVALIQSPYMTDKKRTEIII